MLAHAKSALSPVSLAITATNPRLNMGKVGLPLRSPKNQSGHLLL